MAGSGFTDESMLELFRAEVASHTASMRAELEAPGRDHHDPEVAQHLKRAAHSVKGAARLVGAGLAAELAQALENVFAAASQGKLDLYGESTAAVLQGVDLLARIGVEESQQDDALGREVDSFTTVIDALLEHHDAAPAATASTSAPKPAPTKPAPAAAADSGMLDLFCAEIEAQTDSLGESLLILEQEPQDAAALERLMRAAHSIKGAARMIGVSPAVQLAHAMEDCFVAAQKHALQLQPADIDLLLAGTDALRGLGTELVDNPEAQVAPELTASIAALCAPGRTPPTPVREPTCTPKRESEPATSAATSRVVRISAERANRLVGLTGELTVTSRWVRVYADSLLGLKKRHNDLIAVIDRLRAVVDQNKLSDLASNLLDDAQKLAYDCRHNMAQRLTELEEFDRRASNVSNRLNHEVISSRMRPFGDGVQGFPRLVRDVARSLEKQVELVIRGRDTQVDRDILEKIEAPLNHILRNAIDHGIESPAERTAAGKPAYGSILLEAYHSAGMLTVVVSDDGRGVDMDALRSKIVRNNMVNERMAAELSETELLDFLFLPAFSTRESISEISGRGVGLDVVHDAVQEMRGHIRASSAAGQGMRIQLQLPLTLSVLRTLTVEVGGELYAFPLARIENILRIPRDAVQTLEDRQFVTTSDGRHIGLVYGGQVFDQAAGGGPDAVLPVVVIGGRSRSYGVVVDRFLGERELAVHTIDPRLGKIQDIAAAAITDDGTPLLIVDVDDMQQSIENLVSRRRLHKLSGAGQDDSRERSRILVVDDSLTVREVERKLLESRGYRVDVAVDGMDGWNTVRVNEYDLIISDVDMPRMNGIELVTMIKSDPKLRKLPVMIVSYKDRQEDRERGLEAGADYYLAKGSFHDDTLIEAVVDLIGEPD